MILKQKLRIITLVYLVCIIMKYKISNNNLLIFLTSSDKES